MKKKVLDVTDQRCPLTFLKTKEFLKSNLHCEKKILIKGKDDFEKLTNSIRKNKNKCGRQSCCAKDGSCC